MAYKGKYIPTNPKKYRGDPSQVIYRSLWERKLMVYCDRNSKVVEWGSEEVIIPYMSPKDGRLHILEKMNNVIKTPNEELSQYAPIVSQIQIPESKIREVIGQGGKVIKKICEDFDVKISIEDNGNVNVSGVGSNKVNDTIQYIRDLIAEPEIGKIYPATVDKITNYGAFVNYLKNASGLVQISEFAEEKIASVEEFVSEGDDIKIKVIGKDGDKYRLSYKAVQDGEGILPEYANRNTSRKPGRPHRKDNRRGGDKRSSHKKSSIAGNPYNNEINDDSPKKKKKGLFW